MGKETETGGVLQEDGSIFFRIYAPGSRHVAVEMDKETIELERMADGFFEGKKPGTESCVGLQTVNIYFDGEVMVCPCMPVLWHQDRPVNFLDIPDPETPWISLEKIPHGSLSRELFFSKKWRAGKGAWYIRLQDIRNPGKAILFFIFSMAARKTRPAGAITDGFRTFLILFWKKGDAVHFLL